MTPHSIQGKCKPSCICSLKNSLLVFSLLCGCIFSTATHAADSQLDSINLGIFFGLNYGEATVERVVPTDGTAIAVDGDRPNRVSGLSFALSGVIEKPISDIVRLSAELHLSNVAEPFGSGTSSATGVMISIGGTLGRVETPRSPYLSASVGYSYINIGESNGCSNFALICSGRNDPNQLRPGANAKSLGYRIAIGYSLSKKTRLELAYLNHARETASQPGGFDRSMDTISAGIRLNFM